METRAARHSMTNPCATEEDIIPNDEQRVLLCGRAIEQNSNIYTIMYVRVENISLEYNFLHKQVVFHLHDKIIGVYAIAGILAFWISDIDESHWEATACYINPFTPCPQSFPSHERA